VGSSFEDPEVSKPEKHVSKTPDVHTKNPEEPLNQQNDPPPQTHTMASEVMDIEANPAENCDLPSHIPSSTPIKPVEEISSERNTDDITITSASYNVPGISNMLTKHSFKEEMPLLEKGKTKLDLQNYLVFSAAELHAGYLSHLRTIRHMEVGLVSMMKQKYDVWMNLTPLSLVYIYSHSPQVLTIGKSLSNFVTY